MPSSWKLRSDPQVIDNAICFPPAALTAPPSVGLGRYQSQGQEATAQPAFSRGELVIHHQRVTRSQTKTVIWENSDDTRAACMDEHQSDEDSDRDDACRNEEECAHADRDENDDGDDDQDNGQNDYDAGENTAEDHKYDDAYCNEDDTHRKQTN